MADASDVKMDIALLDGRMMQYGTKEASTLLAVARQLSDDGFPALAKGYVDKAREAMDHEERWQPSLSKLFDPTRRGPLYATDVHKWLVEHGWTPPTNPNDYLEV